MRQRMHSRKFSLASCMWQVMMLPAIGIYIAGGQSLVSVHSISVPHYKSPGRGCDVVFLTTAVILVNDCMATL